jgi:hypothetical protein
MVVGIVPGFIVPVSDDYWDSGMGDLHLSMEVIHHPSQAPPTEATQYESIHHACMGKRDGEYDP